MEEPKRNSVKTYREYMVKVRMSEVEMAMLDTICSIEQKSRSYIIRKLIVFAIHNYHDNEINENKDKNEYLRKLFDSYDMLDILEDVLPSDDEIDKD